jgi:hypothetical protein
MGRLQEPGSEAIRGQLAIVAEDPEVFKPHSLYESLKVARIIRDDEDIAPEIRRLVEVGIVLDLMPGHLRPRRDRMARALGCSVRTLLRREIEWEGVDPMVRFGLVRRAARLIVAMRAADRS